LDVEAGHSVVGYEDAFGVPVDAEFAVDFQAGFGGCRGDQIDDGAIVDQGLGAPVLLRDMTPGLRRNRQA
jgi:hypothetical protein